MEKDFEEEQKKQKRKAWLSFATLIGLMIVLLVAAAFVNRYLFYVVIAIYALMVSTQRCRPAPTMWGR